MITEVNYVPMKLISGRFSKGASLRDYTYDLTSGNYTVKEEKKTGRRIEKNDEVKVIYPLNKSADGNWVQAMNKDGTCGFIRAERLDLSTEKFNAALSRPLKEPYQYFISSAHKKVYEAEIKTKNMDPKELDKAKKDVAAYQAELKRGKEFVELYDKNHQKPFNSLPNTEKTNALADFVSSRGYTHSYGACMTVTSALTNEDSIRMLNEKGIAVTLDSKNGRITSSCSKYDISNIANLNIVSDKIANLPPEYAGCRNAGEDIDNFSYANRIYAESAAVERMNYGKDAALKITQDGFDMNPVLTDPKIQREFEQSCKEPGMVAAEIKENGGLLLCESHSSSDAKDWMTENMKELKESGIGTIYVEHLFEGVMQQAVNDFMKSDKQSPMNPLLDSFCSKDVNRKPFKDMFLAARENDIRIVGIGSDLSQSNTAKNPYERIQTFNQRACEIITADQQNNSLTDKGYIALAGSAHMFLHESTEMGKSLSGMSQILGLHGISIEKKDGKLVPVAEDSNKIYVKESGEHMKVPEYLEKLQKTHNQPQKQEPKNEAERKQISFDELKGKNKENTDQKENQKSDTKTGPSHQWEPRTPSAPFQSGPRTSGPLGYGQHHRTPGGKSI